MSDTWRAALPRWSNLSVTARDCLGGLVLLGLGLVPFVPGVELGELPTSDHPLLSTAVIVAQALPLALRRRRPMLTLTVVGVAFGISQAVGTRPSAAGLALFVALYSAGRWQMRHRWTAAMGAAAAYLALVLVLGARDSPSGPVDWATFGALLAAVWFVGATLRGRAVLERGQKHRESVEALGAERARIARELHDIVSHHVTGMVVQADAGAYAAQLEMTHRALRLIAASGRSALVELRQLLDALDPLPGVGSREPTIPSVAHVIDNVLASGYRVHFVQAGTPGPLADSVALTVARIVQEALSNAMRHSVGGEVSVHIDYRADAVDLCISSGGVDAQWAPGRGIAGMRYRAELVGGRLVATTESDRFVVRATLPSGILAGQQP